jgi:uncharacterized cupredoxin-like copper-binding protein
VKRILIVAAVAALLTAACGGGGGGEQSQSGATPDRTVEVDMVDIAFEPATLTVQQGEVVRFVFRNRGQLPHDAFIGDTAAQADHEKEMRRADTGSQGGGHDMDGGDERGNDRDAVTVDPGKTGELTYTFDRTGTIEIGCHQPGHYVAGMKMAVTVT